MSVAELHVWIDGAPGRVGILSSAGGAIAPVSFAYDPEYLAHPGARPVSASMPLSIPVHEDAGARAFFDNLLPEGERRRSEALRLGMAPTDVMGLLRDLGRECPGAVSVLPPGAEPAKSPGSLDADYEVLDERGLADLVQAAAAGRPMGARMRFSLAGVQEKVALARDPNSGAFLLPRGGAPTTWLLKVEAPRGPLRGIAANEFLCLHLFRSLGLPTVHAERAVVDGIPVLLVARYDRVVQAREVRRIHQEDAAQVLGVPHEMKYEDDAAVQAIPAGRRGFPGLFGPLAGATRAPIDARLLLLRAAFLNWLLGNTDAHLKNFALVQGDLPFGASFGSHFGPGFSLAPFYDVVCVGAYPDFDGGMAMRIGGAARWDEVTRADWASLVSQAFPRRRGAGAASPHLEWFRSAAAMVLPKVDAAVEAGLVTHWEAKAVRDAIGERLRHLNATLGWSIPADTDAVLPRSGGWVWS